MGTIADKLNYLNTTKTNIKNAIIAKGVAVSDNDTFRSYATKISDIPIHTVEALTVTQNGTYTGTGGVTYNPVTVDIDDTDLYRDTTDSTYESVKTLSNCGAFPMLSLKAEINAVQSGSGDPSPTNIRPISGWDEANVVVSPTTDAEDGTTYNIEFTDGTNPLRVYGGTLDVVSGELVVDSVGFDLGTATWIKNTIHPNLFCCAKLSDMKIYQNAAVADWMCSNYKLISGDSMERTDKSIAMLNLNLIYINDSAYTDATAEQFKTAMNGVQLVYELATPQTYQLTPTQVNALLGTNNLWADTGDVGDVRYFRKVEL